MEKYETFRLQNDGELAWLIDTFQREGVKSYLEIGSKFGGSLWRIANALPIGARIVSVDLPFADQSFKNSEQVLRDCIDALKAKGYDAHLFLGSSADQNIISAVRTLSPFDACFIDANHTLPFIKNDWENYGQMARLVCFHDIGWIERPRPGKKMPIEVPKFWEEIKLGYRHEEKKLDARDNGIGVLWR